MACAAEEEGRLALSGQLFGLLCQCGRQGKFRLDKGCAAAEDVHAIQLCGQTVARQGRKVCDCRRRDGLCLGAGQNGLGQRMLAAAFQRCGQRQKLRLRDARGGQQVSDPGRTLGDGAGLVQRHDLSAACGFQRGGGLEEDAVLCAEAVAHHDGHGGRKTQRAGAADDQYRNAPGQRIAQLTAQQEPDDGGEDGDGDDRRDKVARYGVGDLGDRSLGGGGIADHLDDLGQGSVLAHAGSLAAEEARLIGGSGADPVACGLVHRDALAGQGALVHGADTLQHHAVHRDVLAGADDEDVALLHVGDGDGHFRAVPYQRGGLGGQLHQALEGVGGLALGACFQHLAHRDEGQYHGGRLEVELHHIVHDQCIIAVELGVGHCKEGVGAPHIACHGAEGHQRIHVGGTVDEAFEAADEKLLVDDHDDAS